MAKVRNYQVVVSTRLNEDEHRKFDKMLYRIRKTKSAFLRDQVLQVINPTNKAQ